MCSAARPADGDPRPAAFLPLGSWPGLSSLGAEGGQIGVQRHRILPGCQKPALHTHPMVVGWTT